MPSPYFNNYGVVPVTTATLAVNDDAHVGQRLIFDRAAGITATLPPATGSGNRYEIIVATSVTSNQYRIDATGTDKIGGFASVRGSAAAQFIADASANNRINMNGTTTGGLIGTRIVLDDIKAGLWSASVISAGSGTAATPFATI